MSSATVRTLSDYQIHELRDMFFRGCKIHRIGRIDETAELIVEYSGGVGAKSDERKTKKIPSLPYSSMKQEPEDAEFEVLQPKQLNP